MGGRTVVFAVRGPIARSDLPGLCERICTLLGASGASVALCDAGGVPPDAVTVEALARLQLAARRYGCQVRVRNASPELLDLLGFMGLADVVPESDDFPAREPSSERPPNQKEEPMPTSSPRLIFVNLAVEELGRSVRFFTELGFEFDPRFTDETATCMIVSERAFVMLLVRDRFADFTPRELADPRTHTEAILAVSAASREDVDAFADKALGAGGSAANEPMDHGFMYGRSFYDPDGHLWEVVWMDVEASTQQQAEQQAEQQAVVQT